MLPQRSRTLGCLAAAAFLVALGGCDDPTGFGVDALAPVAADLALGAHGSAVTKPFEASLFTAGAAPLAPHPSCGAFPRLLNVQEGEGEATHLGRFTVRITFCIDATDVLDDGSLTEGESLPYDNGFGTLVAANGDELYMEISGAVLPSADPAFDFEFRDPFTFVGGTGRFEGATGAGVTESFVIQALDRTEHRWSGTLTLPLGRR